MAAHAVEKGAQQVTQRVGRECGTAGHQGGEIGFLEIDGWRVTVVMAPGRRSGLRSVIEAGLGLVRPASSRTKASGVSMSGNQACHGAGSQSGTKSSCSAAWNSQASVSSETSE